MDAPSTLDIRLSKRSAGFLWATAAFIFLSRILTLGKFLPNAESVNFALALSRYDLTALQPHLPGYPVYIAFARAFSFFGLPDPLSLALPGLLSAAFAVFPFFYLTRRIYGLRQANLAVILYALHPGLFIASLKPSYPAMLLFPFLFSLRMLLRNLLLPPYLRERTRFYGLYWGAIAMGLLVGIEAAAAVLLLPLVAVSVYGYVRLKRKKILLETFNGILAGFCLWAIPFFFTVSMGDLISVGTGLKNYSYIAFSDCTGLLLLEKAKLFLWNLFSTGFMVDFSHPAMGLLALALVSIAFWYFLGSLGSRFKEWYLLIFILPYAAWSLLFRNLKDPSVLVLVEACLTVFIAVGIYRIKNTWFKFILMGLIILVLGGGSLFRSLEYRKGMPPETAMVEFISRLQPPDNAPIFCGSSIRQLKYLYPEYLSFGIRSVKDIDVIAERTVSRDVLITSEVEGVSESDGRFHKIARFLGPEPLYGKGNAITLYRFQAPRKPAGP